MSEHAAVIALVKLTAQAEEAASAGRAVGAENTVALGHAADVVAHLDHRADVLMTESESLFAPAPCRG